MKLAPQVCEALDKVIEIEYFLREKKYVFEYIDQDGILKIQLRIPGNHTMGQYATRGMAIYRAAQHYDKVENK